MECFLCEREAARECPRCGLLYCLEHGDVLCERCMDPAHALPSHRLYRGALFTLVAASVIALWLLLWPSVEGDGDATADAVARPTPNTVIAAIASPTAPPTPVTDAATTPTPSPTATATPSPTVTPSPAATATASLSPTATPTASPTPTPTPTATSTPTPTPTATPTPSPTATPTPEPTPRVPRRAYIANAGAGGVLERNDCIPDSRLAGTGWFDGDEVTIEEEGSGRCDGWSFIVSNDDGRESWILNEYLSDEAP